MKCTYCNNSFTTKTSLNTHQKTAKYCLKIRGKDITSQYSCIGCSKSFVRKYEYNRHLSICDADMIVSDYKLQLCNLEKNNYQLTNKNSSQENRIHDLEQTVNEQKQTIRELQDKLENIAIKAVQRPTTTNNMNKTQVNNFIQKMEPLSQKFLVDKAPNLTIEHVQKGASGYAEYALEYPLKDRVACVDYSRRKIKFKDIDGNVVTDPEMMKLAPMFFDSIKDKSSALVHSLNTPDMDSAMFEEVANLFNTNADVKNGSTGVKTEFYHDFVKHVCSGSVME